MYAIMYNHNLRDVESPLLWLIKGCSCCSSAFSPVWLPALHCQMKPSVQVDLLDSRYAFFVRNPDCLVWSTEALRYTSLVPINGIGLCIDQWPYFFILYWLTVFELQSELVFCPVMILAGHTLSSWDLEPYCGSRQDLQRSSSSHTRSHLHGDANA